MIANPALAADPHDFAFTPNHRESSSMYVGATVSFTGTRQKRLAPSFALDAGARRSGPATGHLAAIQPRAPLLMLQPGADGTEVRLGGRSLWAKGDGGPDAGTILLALAAAAGGAFLVSQIVDSDKDKDDDQCMIEPELCD